MLFEHNALVMGELLALLNMYRLDITCGLAAPFANSFPRKTFAHIAEHSRAEHICKKHILQNSLQKNDLRNKVIAVCNTGQWSDHHLIGGIEFRREIITSDQV